MPTRGPEPGGAAANPTPGGAAANPPPGDSTGPATDGRLIAALVVGQLGLHGVMAGLRMAVPLAALREGASAWTVGLLLSLFALAPVLLALHSGRLADRHGYHRPVRLAALVTAAGAALALASTWTEGAAKWALLAGAAMATGTGANLGMLTIQRTAGLAAADSAERMKVFSWLAVAPSFANVIGPVAVGVAIDLAGFRAAYALLVVVPALTLATTRLVPRLPPPPAPQPGAEAGGAGAWDLLALPQMKRLLGVNGVSVQPFHLEAAA
jgi:MFS family permease